MVETGAPDREAGREVSPDWDDNVNEDAENDSDLEPSNHEGLKFN